MGGVRPDRVVEVRASAADGTNAMAGSGILLGDRGVLTARHIVAPALDSGQSGRIRARVGDGRYVDLALVGTDERWDLAVLRVNDARWRAPDSPTPDIRDTGPGVLGCETVGFPDENLQPTHDGDPADALRQPEQAYGRLMPGGRTDDGRVPFDVDASVPDDWCGWKGMSGAAVLSSDARELVGVAVDVAEGRQQRRLLVVPIMDAMRESAVLNEAIAGASGAQRIPRYRVCFVSSEWSPHVHGGLGVHVERLTAALAEHPDVDIEVVLPRLGGSESYSRLTGATSRHLHLRPVLSTADRPPTYADPLSWLTYASDVSVTVGQIIREGLKPDVMHCHDWVTALGALTCRYRYGIPLVFHLHLPNLTEPCRSIERLALLCADKVTVSSGSMSGELQSRHGVPEGKIEVVKNGVDLGVFRPSEDCCKDGGYILFVGRLVDQKGVEYLLRALPYIRLKFGDCLLRIVGDGESRIGLENLRRNLLLPGDAVEFLGWVDSREKLARLYQEARVVVVPSISEPFGMTALEALACKRPVVASDIQGLSEILGDSGQCGGFLVAPEDELGIAQRVMQLLGDEDLRKTLGEDGYKLACSYSWQTAATEFCRLYARLRDSAVDRNLTADIKERREVVEHRVEEMDKDEEYLLTLGRLLDWGQRVS